MKVSRLDIYEFYLPFRFAFRHAASTRDANRTVIVKLTTEQGRVGFGEAIPRPYLTGESSESVVETLAVFWRDWLRDYTIPAPEKFNTALTTLWQRPDVQNNLAAFAAVDVALWDLAQIKHSNLIPPAARERVVVLPLLNGMATVAAVAGARAAGYRRFKLKLSQVDQLKKVALYKRLLSKNDWVVVDANMAFGADEALFVAKELKRLGVNLFEQPCAAFALDDLAKIERDVALPVMADESLCSLQQAKDIVRINAASVWNIRLAKNGGLTGANELAALAQKHGKQIYSGCLVGETTLLHQAQSIFLSRAAGVIAAETGFSRLLLEKNPLHNQTFGSGSDSAFEHNIKNMPRYYKSSAHQ